MDESLKINLLGKAVIAIRQVARITNRRLPEQVISDALQTYEWILRQQTNGKKIILRSSNPGDELELENFIKNPAIALEYFHGRVS